MHFLSIRNYRRPLVLLLAALAALGIAYQPPQRCDWTSAGASLDGFHAPEDQGRFRWSDGRASVRFDGVGQQPYRLTVRLGGSRPTGLPSPRATVSANAHVLGVLQTTRAEQEFTFEIPAESVGAWGNLAILVESDTFTPPNDLRTLGVIISEVRIESGGGVPVVPAPAPLAWGALAVMALGSAGARRRAAGAALALLLALTVGIAGARLVAATALPWVALGALTLAAGARLKERTTWRETLAALAAGLSGVRFAAACMELLRNSRFTDVQTMFEAAQKLLAGLDPYDYAIVRDNPLYQHSYVYPPVFAQFLALFLPFGIDVGIRLWVALNFVLYGAAVWGLLRAFDLRFRSAGMYAFLVVALNFQPALDTLSGGQLDVLILALLLAAALWTQSDRIGRAGAAVALAGMTKLHPLFLGLFFLPRARWRGLVVMGAVVATVLGISALSSSPDLYVRYTTVVLPGRGGEGTGNPENQSVAGFFYRAHGVLWNDAATPAQAQSIRIWTSGASGALALATLWAWRRGSRKRGGAMLQFGTLIVLLLLVLPTSWMHYETQALLPLAVMLSYALAGAARGERAGALLAWGAAGILAAFANQEIFRGGEFDALPLLLAQSYKFYGMLLLWGMLIWAQARKDEDAEGDGDGADLQRA